MEQLPGLDTAARMEQLPGWNNYLGSNLRPQTTRALTLPIEPRGASTGMRSQNVQNTGHWARLSEALRPGAPLSALAADRHRDSDPAHQSSLSLT